MIQGVQTEQKQGVEPRSEGSHKNPHAGPFWFSFAGFPRSSVCGVEHSKDLVGFRVRVSALLGSGLPCGDSERSLGLPSLAPVPVSLI